MESKKIEEGVINHFQGKKDFNVSDLIFILNKIDPKAKVNFGVIENNLNLSTGFYQDENIVFRCRQKDNSLEDYDTLDILTYAYEREI